MKLVYLDNAATTLTDPEVSKAMKPYFSEKYGNASEYHSLGRKAGQAVEIARQKLADFLGAAPEEIIFTSSATESINLSHKGLVEGKKRPHIITSSIEHKAVLETCRHLENLAKAGVSYLPVDTDARIDLKALERAIRPETILVSIIYANNEVGTIQQIREIGLLIKKLNNSKARRKHRIYFHTDATQAVQYLNCKVDYLGVDLLSLTGHKIYAPKGIGVLYKRNGVPLIRQMDGGNQERGLRAGTENVPYIVGLGKAIELIEKSKDNDSKKVRKLREKLIKRVLKIPGAKLTGHPVKRAPHIVSFIIEGVEGEAMVLLLSEAGIMVSTGSACSSNDLQASHVLTAMGIPAEKSHGSIRFSLGKNTTKEDIDLAVKTLTEVVEALRKMAPDLKKS